MKAVILAAGLGKRLRPVSNSLPKGLIEINGKPLLEYSLNALEGIGIKEVVIVVGFLGDGIRQKIGKEYHGLKITYASNKEYAKTGSMYSLSRARGIIDDDIILLESDLIYEPKAIKTLLDSSCREAMLVATLRGAGDKVYICVDNEQRITELGKNIPTKNRGNVIGEMVGISRFSQEFLYKLFQNAERDYALGKLCYHYEETVLKTSKSDNPVYAVLCEDLVWTEIDNEDDLKKAKEQIYPKIKTRM